MVAVGSTVPMLVANVPNANVNINLPTALDSSSIAGAVSLSLHDDVFVLERSDRQLEHDLRTENRTV